MSEEEFYKRMEEDLEEYERNPPDPVARYLERKELARQWEEEIEQAGNALITENIQIKRKDFLKLSYLLDITGLPMPSMLSTLINQSYYRTKDYEYNLTPEDFDPRITIQKLLKDRESY